MKKDTTTLILNLTLPPKMNKFSKVSQEEGVQSSFNSIR